MLDHPQFEYYKNRRMDPKNNKADEQLLREFWGAQVDKTANGKPVVTIAWHK